MKFIPLVLPVLGLVSATPLSQLLSNSKQGALPGYKNGYPGYDLDLSAQRLIEMEDMEPLWMTEMEKIIAKAHGVNFMDITENLDLGNFANSRAQVASTFPAPNATDRVKRVLKLLSTDGPKADLAKFTSFRTRYYRSDTGKQSQQWLIQRITEITKQWAAPSLQEIISIREFTHSWGQNSIIVRINGSSEASEGVLVLGAHLDSTNMWPFMPAPGADDDGSGTMTILEAYRALIAADFRPLHSVEFHWYSAEEGGLLGSQAVAQNYASSGVNVIAMTQFDMTAWVKKGTEEAVGIITDFTSPALTKFNTQLVDKYLAIPYVFTKCGYACSDHASWTKAGYPSAFSIESTFENSNSHIHTGDDRIDISDEFSFEHMLEFSKLAVAFTIELGGESKSG